MIEIVEDLTQDWGLDIESIDGSTLLVKQLDFASVDIIQLCVALEQHHGRKLGFQELLMVDGKYVDDLSITQVSDFINNRLHGGAQPRQ
ncbi:MAG: acyl carrier protein [Myxococcota bacterium]